nr:putative retrotransposon protein [Tanacetum cinerariifolium]
MAIQGGRIQKANKKLLNPKGKEQPAKDDACHNYKEVRHWKRNCLVYLAELIKKKKQVGTASSLDRGGEYISQEFKDYLKGCGIVQQLTHPYTPQHNEAFERRNRTLDMVRLMINLTTLPLSFWDYTLETATRILNMVLTKKGMLSSWRKIFCLKKSVGGRENLNKFKQIAFKKTEMDGIVHTYKARLVAKGYTQTYGVDYKETFSPVADIRAIRILIAIATFYDCKIWKMDVKTAFLNSYCDEDIYMVSHGVCLSWGKMVEVRGIVGEWWSGWKVGEVVENVLAGNS